MGSSFVSFPAEAKRRESILRALEWILFPHLRRAGDDIVALQGVTP
jgi:hypothetical protein